MLPFKVIPERNCTRADDSKSTNIITRLIIPLTGVLNYFIHYKNCYAIDIT